MPSVLYGCESWLTEQTSKDEILYYACVKSIVRGERDGTYRSSIARNRYANAKLVNT